MAPSGDDMINHRRTSGGTCNRWGPKGTMNGSPFFSHSFTYQYNPFTTQRPALEFPAVPYGPTDFHCQREVTGDPFGWGNGWLVGLSDLNTGKDYVQNRIATYFATLLSLGISGFRIDAAKVVCAYFYLMILLTYSIHDSIWHLPIWLASLASCKKRWVADFLLISLHGLKFLLMQAVSTKRTLLDASLRNHLCLISAQQQEGLTCNLLGTTISTNPSTLCCQKLD
jgi:Alpha amylase, catalytic domain